MTTSHAVITHHLDIVVSTTTPGTTLVVSGVLREKIADLYARMAAHPEITDKDSFDSMRVLVKDAATLKNQVESSRQVAKAPFLSIGRMLDKAANAISQEIDVIVSEGKQQETVFLIERDRKLAEEAERFRQAEAAAQKDVSRPTAPLSQLAPSEIINAPITTRRVVVVTNPELLPDEYWTVDKVKLDYDVLGGKIVLGTEIVIQKSVVAR